MTVHSKPTVVWVAAILLLASAWMAALDRGAIGVDREKRHTERTTCKLNQPKS